MPTKRSVTSVMMLFLLLSVSSLYAAAVLADEKGLNELEMHNISDAEKVKWARATKVSIVDAIKTATSQVPGQVVQATLESLNGRLLYEVEVVTSDGKVIELFIDPRTGNLIEVGGKK